MERFQNKYRIQSHRMPQWDYSGDGIYFITMVTQNRECQLGFIRNGEIILSDFGKIVHDEWLESFDIRHELFLDEYIIMPNHLHAIIVLDSGINRPNSFNGPHGSGRLDDLNGSHGSNDANGLDGLDGLDGSHGSHGSHVETHGRASLQSQQSQQSQQSHQSHQPQQSHQPHQSHQSPSAPSQSTFIRKPQSISSFIAGFKSAVNSKIDDYIDEYHLDIPKYNKNNHFFQPNYHDHIIRNNTEYQRIKNYIIQNPLKWVDDKFYLS